MRSVHLGIPELEERNLSSEEFFRIISIMLDHELHYLEENHPDNNIDDIEAYRLKFARRILKSAITLHSVIERDKDYVVANAIVRSLADSISIFILIYEEENNEIVYLRHYLYIIDGLYERLKLLQNSTIDNIKSRKDDYFDLKNQIESTQKNFEEAYSFCTSKIKDLTIYKGYAYAIDSLIERSNWKFKTYSSGNNKKNIMSWHELYSKLDFNNAPNMPAFFSSLSEFVHGLSPSNFIYDNEDITFEPIYGIATSLVGKLHEVINKLYAQEFDSVRSKMISALYDECMPAHYVKQIIDDFLKVHSNEDEKHQKHTICTNSDT